MERMMRRDCGTLPGNGGVEGVGGVRREGVSLGGVVADRSYACMQRDECSFYGIRCLGASRACRWWLLLATMLQTQLQQRSAAAAAALAGAWPPPFVVHDSPWRGSARCWRATTCVCACMWMNVVRPSISPSIESPVISYMETAPLPMATVCRFPLRVVVDRQSSVPSRVLGLLLLLLPSYTPAPCCVGRRSPVSFYVQACCLSLPSRRGRPCRPQAGQSVDYWPFGRRWVDWTNAKRRLVDDDIN